MVASAHEARVNECKKLDDETLFSETVPKLWDMPNEEAAAVMRQWTSIDLDMPNVISVRCEVECSREANDRWGDAVVRKRSPPVISLETLTELKAILAKGDGRKETQPPGPPWGRAHPPKKAMAFFASQEPTAEGQRPLRPGIAVFSPMSTDDWNFGPHGQGLSNDPQAGPCMHVAPLDKVALGPASAMPTATGSSSETDCRSPTGSNNSLNCMAMSNQNSTKPSDRALVLCHS
ncbi:MAG: hypothetical protein R3C56_36740 [Pirellulaceae bacterium]